MIKIVSSQADLKGFDVTQLYTVFRVDGAAYDIRAVATSLEEAHDAQEMLCDLVAGQYHVFPPSGQAN